MTEQACLKRIMGVEPKHEMYLNVFTLQNQLHWTNVEPKHEMYLNLNGSKINKHTFVVEPKHEMYLNTLWRLLKKTWKRC